MSGTVQSAQIGSQTAASGAFGVFPIGFGYYPAEGSRAITLSYNWTSATNPQQSFTEDLSMLVAYGVSTSIQAIFIDNSTCPLPVTLVIAGTQQVIVCPGLSQGVFPVFFTGTPMYTISVALQNTGGFAGYVTRLILLNVPANGGVWQTGTAGNKTINPLAINSVTVAGVAVQAINLGFRAAGGWIANPATAVTNLGINERGVASGTSSAGDTTFIAPGQTYMLSPSLNVVSVISSDAPHPFSGYGFT